MVSRAFRSTRELCQVSLMSYGWVWMNLDWDWCFVSYEVFAVLSICCPRLLCAWNRHSALLLLLCNACIVSYQSINRFPGKNYKSEYRKTDISIEIVKKKETYGYLIGSNTVLPSAFPAVSYSTLGLCAILIRSVHTVESESWRWSLHIRDGLSSPGLKHFTSSY